MKIISEIFISNMENMVLFFNINSSYFTFSIWLVSLFVPNGYSFIFWLARNLWAPFVLFGCGFYVSKVNSIKEPDQNYILVANHASYIDVMVMFRMSSTPFCFCWEERASQNSNFWFFI